MTRMFAAPHESGFGTFEKCRPNELMSEFEGGPDLRRTWHFGRE